MILTERKVTLLGCGDRSNCSSAARRHATLLPHYIYQHQPSPHPDFEVSTKALPAHPVPSCLPVNPCCKAGSVSMHPQETRRTDRELSSILSLHCSPCASTETFPFFRENCKQPRNMEVLEQTIPRQKQTPKKKNTKKYLLHSLLLARIVLGLFVFGY